MDGVIASAAIAVPFVIAIVAAIRGMWQGLSNRWAPGLNIVAGIGWSFMSTAITDEFGARQILLSGLIAGLMAGGLYSGVVKPAVLKALGTDEPGS